MGDDVVEREAGGDLAGRRAGVVVVGQQRLQGVSVGDDPAGAVLDSGLGGPGA
jgi:hypothetical protein